MRIWIAVIVGLCFALTGSATAVVASDFPPTPQDAVNDYANLLTESQRFSLEGISRQLLSDTGDFLAVAIIETLGDTSMADYATGLFEAWGIGDADKDNGVLILLAMAEQEMAIEVGYGLEHVLTDARSGQIIDLMRPHFQNNDFKAGLEAGMTAIAERLSEVDNRLPEAAAPVRANTGATVFRVLLYLLLGVVAVFLGWVLFTAYKRYSASQVARRPECHTPLEKTETVKERPTQTREGIMLLQFSCPNCGYESKKEDPLFWDNFIWRRELGMGQGMGSGSGPGAGSGGGSGYGGGRSGGGGARGGW